MLWLHVDAREHINIFMRAREREEGGGREENIKKLAFYLVVSEFFCNFAARKELQHEKDKDLDWGDLGAMLQYSLGF